MYYLRKREKVPWRTVHAHRTQTIPGTHWIFSNHWSREAEGSWLGWVPAWNIEVYVTTLPLADALGSTDNIRHDAFGIDFLLLPLFTLSGGIFNPLLTKHFLLLRSSMNVFSYLSAPNPSYACTFYKNQSIGGTKTLFLLYDKVI